MERTPTTIPSTPLHFFQAAEVSTRQCELIQNRIQQEFGKRVSIVMWKQAKTETGWQSQLMIEGSNGRFLDISRRIEDLVDLPEHQLRAEIQTEKVMTSFAVLRQWLLALLKRSKVVE